MVGPVYGKNDLVRLSHHLLSPLTLVKLENCNPGLNPAFLYCSLPPEGEWDAVASLEELSRCSSVFAARICFMNLNVSVYKLLRQMQDKNDCVCVCVRERARWLYLHTVYIALLYSLFKYFRVFPRKSASMCPFLPPDDEGVTFLPLHLQIVNFRSHVCVLNCIKPPANTHFLHSF